MSALRVWRRERGLSQAQLADAIGGSKSAISMYEHHVLTPPVAVCTRLAEALGIDPNVLIHEYHGFIIAVPTTPRGADTDSVPDPPRLRRVNDPPP